MKGPRFTMRKHERMTTFALKFHATERLVDWVATKLGCSRARALKAIRSAYEEALGGHMMMRTIIFDAESDDKIRVVHDDEVDELNEGDVWHGGLH